MVIWNDNAISHITNFIDNTKNETEDVAKSYMGKLIDYAEILEKRF